MEDKKVTDNQEDFFSSKAYIDAMKAFVIITNDDVLGPLVKYKNDDYFWSDCFSNSYQGLYSVISAAGLPFNLINDGIVQRRFQYFHSAARIRNLRRPVPGEARIELSQEEKDRQAYQSANKEMEDFFESKEGVDFLRNQIVSDINNRLISPEIRMASEELLIQTLISAWSVFESFSRNIIIAFVNTYPSLATPILASPELKDFFGKQSVGISLISEHGYDLSKSMGNIIFNNRRLDSLASIRAVMKAIFDSGKLQKALGPEMWLVNQRRHLFVHSRGIVDADYVKNTSDNLNIGDKLILDAHDVEKSILAVRDALLEICDSASKYEG